MKKMIVLLFCMFLFIPVVVHAGEYISSNVTATVNTHDMFTDPLSPMFKSEGNVNISVHSDTMDATITLQRKFRGAVTWRDWTANAEQRLVDTERGMLYRLGVKNGGHTSGTIQLRLSK